ncbi:LrgB family protein [Gracilibacillus alcaliphilus]|uniref:LrgB family protein n=1 Tax=Gracilibacillus alcaliphilus TaxID=1401441 RepID=UPI00195EDE02|nr:LrgB family protein [Gracilibacillus alcaliphilus]MBM7678478.1 putative murein hydrolase (TIGR00659 family) [Gracilibacillus alcaliphilus]
MIKLAIGVAAVTITILLYVITKLIYMKKPNPFLLPIFLSTACLVLLLVITDTSYQTYMIGGQWIDFFLGPIVVSLAIPLYRQLSLIKKYLWPIGAGIFAGSITGILSGILGVKLFHFEDWLIQTVAAKSVTAPIAISITETAGGNISLVAVFVMTAGISGAMFGPLVLKACRIRHPAAKGLGIGTASHAIGTAKALEIGELEGAVSALSMTITAIVVSFLVPLVLLWI